MSCAVRIEPLSVLDLLADEIRPSETERREAEMKVQLSEGNKRLRADANFSVLSSKQ